MADLDKRFKTPKKLDKNAIDDVFEQGLHLWKKIHIIHQTQNNMMIKLDEINKKLDNIINFGTFRK